MPYAINDAVRTLILIALLGAPLAPSALAADPVLLGLADPDVNFVVGVDVRGLSQSSLVQQALASAQSGKPEIGALLGAMGSNPLEKLEEILIVGHVETGEGDAQGLVLARGDFSDPAILAAVCSEGCDTVDYKGFQLHQTALRDEPGGFVTLDDHYAVLGSPDEVRRVLDRRSSGQSSNLAAALSGWAPSLRGHQLWLSARGPFEAPAAAGPPALGAAAESLEAFSLGLTMGADVELALELRAVDAAKAKELYDMAQGLLLLASAGQEQNPEAAELLRSLNLAHAGSSITASLRVPEASFAQAVSSGMASQTATSSATSDAAPTRPAQPKPREGVIRIYGLEDDAVEFESQQNQAP